MSEFTKTRTLVGSPNFLAPEVMENYSLGIDNLSAKKNRKWDYFKSDVFSLGLSILSAVKTKNYIPEFHFSGSVL